MKKNKQLIKLNFIAILFALPVVLVSQNYSEEINRAFLKGKEMKNIPSIENIFLEGTQWELVSNSISASVKLQKERTVRKFLEGNYLQINDATDIGTISIKSKNTMEIAANDTAYEADKVLALKNDTVVIEIKLFEREDKSGWYSEKSKYREIYTKMK